MHVEEEPKFDAKRRKEFLGGRKQMVVIHHQYDGSFIIADDLRLKQQYNYPQFINCAVIYLYMLKKNVVRWAGSKSVFTRGSDNFNRSVTLVKNIGLRPGVSYLDLQHIELRPFVKRIVNMTLAETFLSAGLFFILLR